MTPPAVPPGPPMDAWAPPHGPVLDQSPPPPGSRGARGKLWPRLLMWGGIALMIVGFVGLVGDWAARNIEMNRLLSGIEASEAAMVAAQNEIGAVELTEDPTPEEIEKASGQLEEASGEGRDAVAAATAGVADVTFLPWHSEMVSAQRAYLAHNKAWIDYLAAGSEDAGTLFGEDNAIDPTWRQAEVAVRQAIPPMPWPMIADRIETIFTDDQPEDSGGNDEGRITV